MIEDPDATAFLAFRQECIWLQATLHTFEMLFESGPETLDLLSATAPAFFRDVNLIIQEHFVLQACRLTDPPVQKGRQNLTVKNINEALERRGLMSPEIRAASTVMHNYRELLLVARNQIISHADKARILSCDESPPHARAELERFVAALHEYVDLVGEALGVGPLDFSRTGSDGDAEDLIACLKRGLSRNTS